MKKLRVIVDFHNPEQQALEALCQADYRLPDDQIRWLVINEAKQRGFLPTNENIAVNAREGSHGDVDALLQSNAI